MQGAAFNVLRKRLWPLRASRKRTVLRLLEAAGTAVATVGVMAGLSMTVGRCVGGWMGGWVFWGGG